MSEQKDARTLRREKRARSIRVAKQGRARDAIGALTPGCEIYILTFGQFSLIHALTAILEQTGPADVNVSTWTATLYTDTPPAVVEAICTQVKTMRDARVLIEKDGVVVTDGKNNAVEHPAIAIEQKTLKHISDLNKTWAISD